jgi:tRNA 2-selenouridine synthase
MMRMLTLLIGAMSSTGTAAFSASATTPHVRLDTADYRALLLNDAPMMDVRAPVEFAEGSFPSARNLPLLTDDERHQVGICYKENGQAAAIELGKTFLAGDVKAERFKKWNEFITTNPDHGYLYCFRGGLRSQSVQQGLQDETGIRYPLVTGGYKAMRRFLLDEMDRSLEVGNSKLILVSGKTGTGKTRVIEQLKHCSVDLEGLAHHRGSTFGQLPENPDQPSQINFENEISIKLLKLLDAGAQGGETPQVFVEDESNRIGRLNLPKVLSDRMKANDGIVVIEESMEKRVDVLMEMYGVDLLQYFVDLYGDEQGAELHQTFLLDSLGRIRNRLGGDRHDEIIRLVTVAFEKSNATGDVSLHRLWVAALLEYYYDPMYEFQLAKREGQVLFRGERDAVIEWAKTATAGQMKPTEQH